MVIQTSFAPILAPIIADLFHRKKLKNLERHFKITTNWVFMVSFPLFLLIMLFPRELLSIWGKGFDAGWLGLIIIAVSMIINCSVGQVKEIIMMTGKSRLNLLNDGTAFTLAIILNILLIPRYGYLGASISFAAAVFTLNIMGFIEVYILLKMHPYKLSILKPLAAGIIVFSIIFIIKRYIFDGSASIIWLISLIAIFLVLYSGLLLAFRLNQEDKVVINMIRSGLRFRSSGSGSQ
jgi:O-antigen/teichoic acid export membrane protein